MRDSRKKDFDRTIDEYDKEFRKLTSQLPDSSAKDMFNNRWGRFKRRADEIN